LTFRILILGYGNTLRGDDGLGVIVAQRLAEKLAAEDGVDVIDAHQLLPEMAHTISQYDYVYFVDAAARGVPGTFAHSRVEPVGGDETAFSHNVSPARLLLAAQTLYGRRPAAELCTVAAASFEFGEQLTPSVAATVALVVDYVARRIENVNGVAGG
jgi:hydrogenase maturation protease